MCSGKSCAKIILFIFNFIFTITGAAVMGVGIYIKVDPSLSALQDIIDIKQERYLDYAAYILIGFGAFVLLVGFFGCCGALMESKMLLCLYITCLCIICAGELGAGITAAVMKDKVVDTLEQTFADTILNPIIYNGDGKDTSVKNAWDVVQVWLKCCGSYNFTDYVNIKFDQKDQYVPPSCCILTNDDPTNPAAKDLALCQLEAKGYNYQTDNPNLYKFIHPQGCFQAARNVLDDNLGALIGVGVGIAVVQLLGIILACCVCRQGKEDGLIY